MSKIQSKSYSVYKAVAKCDQYWREKTISRYQLKMTQLLKLSNKDFKAAIKNMLHEVKLNMTEINGKVVLKRETENIFKNWKF